MFSWFIGFHIVFFNGFLDDLLLIGLPRFLFGQPCRFLLLIVFLLGHPYRFLCLLLPDDTFFHGCHCGVQVIVDMRLGRMRGLELRFSGDKPLQVFSNFLLLLSAFF